MNEYHLFTFSVSTNHMVNDCYHSSITHTHTHVVILHFNLFIIIIIENYFFGLFIPFIGRTEQDGKRLGRLRITCNK